MVKFGNFSDVRAHLSLGYVQFHSKCFTPLPAAIGENDSGGCWIMMIIIMTQGIELGGGGAAAEPELEK